MISNRRGPLLTTPNHTKDPCPVFDGQSWHIFGTIDHGNGWQVLHAVAPSIDGPYEMVEPCILQGVDSPNACAPGVVYENGVFHMFVQTEFYRTGGLILHLTSHLGDVFELRNTVLEPIGFDEAGIYDPHPCVYNDWKYLTYSGFTPGKHVQGDIYLAKSEDNTWNGNWHRLGKILGHEEVPFHNPKDHADYEWGLEGSNILQLPSGRSLLSCVCFLKEGQRGTRQRIFLATADSIVGKYEVVGTLEPEDPWGAGETGHAAMVLHDGAVHMFYQAFLENWKYGIACIDLR